jgi:hypothetical protein
MVYNTQNHWVSGLCPSSGILNTVKLGSNVIKGPKNSVINEYLTEMGTSTVAKTYYSASY